MYSDIIKEGDVFRKEYKDGLDAFLKRKLGEADERRSGFLVNCDFLNWLEENRKSYLSMLGLDRIEECDLPESELTRVGEDESAVIYRTRIYITPEIPQYGLLFVPHGISCAPLIIAQHGGGGTPELCSDMNGKNNYNRMVRRLLERRAVVFAPQLLLWNFGEPLATQPKHDIPFKRQAVDRDLKRLGLSLTAVEIKGIMNALDFLSQLDFIDGERIGMMGISYGGYFTLHTMAADTRIKAGFSNACFNDRNVYTWNDWVYPNSANLFQDAEVAALCAPRKLYVAVGKEDEVFHYGSAVMEAERAKEYFKAAGCPQSFVFSLWDGGHTLPDTNEGIDFMFSALAQ